MTSLQDYNREMETKEVNKTDVYYHKKLNKLLIFECIHPNDGALYLMCEYDMFDGDFHYEGIHGAIIYYAVEKTLLWPTAYKYGEPLLNKEAES